LRHFRTELKIDSMSNNKFQISESLKRRFPEMVELILSARSMTEDEKKYWTQLLPLMPDDQMSELKNILLDEKNSLATIDAKYNEQKAMLDELEKSLSKQERLSGKIKQLRQVEAREEDQENIEQEKILNELNNE